MVLDLLDLNTPQYFDQSEREDFEKYLTEEIEDYFIIEGNGVIIGSGGINYFPEEQSARIAWDMIKPEFHKKGIGQRLLKYRLNLLKESNSVNTVMVRTSQFAYGFYEKMGFELKRIDTNYWAQGIDLYFMEKDLRS